MVQSAISPVVSQNNTLIGKQVGSYRIVEVLATRAFACTCLAIHPELNRQAIVKVLFNGNTHSHAHFRQQLQPLAALQHPNLATVLDAAPCDSGYYITRQYICGKSLEQYPAQGIVFARPHLYAILSRVADALDYVHAAGIVHKNIKPSNIIITPNDQPVLVDFGLAWSDNVTHTAGDLFAPPYYLSPEQAVSAADASPASDIYALGVVIFELLAGTPPYVADSPLGVALKHVNDPIPDIKAFVPDAPDAVNQVLQTALAKNPALRFDTATAMVQALIQAWPPDGTISAGLPIVTVNSVSTPSTKVMPVTRRKSALNKKRFFWGLGTIIGLLILSLGVFFNLRPSPILPPTFTPMSAALLSTPSVPAPIVTPPPSATLPSAPQPIVQPALPVTPTLTTVHTPTTIPTRSVAPDSLPAATSLPVPTPTPVPLPTQTPIPIIAHVDPTNTPTTAEAMQALRGKILFKTDRAGRVEIYRMNADGSDQKALEPEWSYLYNEAVRWEAFSPDQRQTIVVRGEGQLDLWNINIDTGLETRLTSDSAADYDPVWSRVSNRIVYVSEKSGSGDLYLLTLDGSWPVQLTFSPDFDKHPSWSPDGTQVVFWSNQGSSKNWQIWRTDVQQPGPINLSNNTFRDWDPVWVK